jgi:hypothetical protein
MENIHINFTAIIVAVIANFVLGFVWYTPLFGKRWAKEHGIDMTNAKPRTAELVRGMAFMIVGNFLLAWVFAHNIAAWAIVQSTPPPAGVEAMPPVTPMGNVIASSLFTWLGFFLPVDLGRVAWERKSWTLFFIDTGYHLISLFLVAIILVYMK